MAWQRGTVHADSSPSEITRPQAACANPSCCGILLDSLHRGATRSGRPIRLGRFEFGMLELMLTNRGTIFSRKAFIRLLWQGDQSIDLRTVDVHVARLRRALTLRCAPNPIHTIRGQGYAFDASCEKHYREWLRHPSKLRLRAGIDRQPPRNRISAAT